MSGENIPIVQFRKPAVSGGNRRNVRARKADSDSSEDEGGIRRDNLPSSIVAKTDIARSSLLSTNSVSSVNPKVSGVTAVFESSGSILPQQYAGDATATVEIDALNGIPGKVAGSYGPVKAPSFLRATSRFDYQPDVCKDYKETGFCGFGDSCKFLHDRSDYKSGWQLEKEWDEKQRERKRKLQEIQNNVKDDGEEGDVRQITASKTGDNNDGESKETKESTEFPFACYICRESFRDPVITLCGHYFCQDCAFKRNKTSSKCAVCAKPTNGIFNKARKLAKHIESIKNKD